MSFAVCSIHVTGCRQTFLWILLCSRGLEELIVKWCRLVRKQTQYWLIRKVCSNPIVIEGDRWLLCAAT